MMKAEIKQEMLLTKTNCVELKTMTAKVRNKTRREKDLKTKELRSKLTVMRCQRT